MATMSRTQLGPAVKCEDSEKQKYLFYYYYFISWI
jgi:hypothetical protein